ncbi:MAG: hypothetical protein A2015_06365 [Spirochaetes bacterium GWF1_31_7]|nr:MAG: hypothetical protein A2Y30_08200 [Spirochaetes bacterium GWE1_32_154]OHD51370.1 MAG: hypothetical protein A2Y29_14585 [Spirochaetes bacterium GWE2_31_10]OHD53096.1 MAG: hypothetical protein A2015_06365 [Spirochaetes bacterium GWF1_31_7]OHD80888.1 MAG: hypothetical protein A2355_16755 [Spirochaetes bacterium RIFOXYB1_FULL_32_8]HBD94485.1 hypothetical protein [Spirochaetia bacterium]
MQVEKENTSYQELIRKNTHLENENSDFKLKPQIANENLQIYKDRIFDKNRVLSVLKFIDWVITLPAIYEEKLKEEVDKMEVETMAYVTSFERLAKRKTSRYVQNSSPKI